jgi:hypothetical protein
MSNGTLARYGLRIQGKTFGYAGSDYPAIMCQNAVLALPTGKETTRAPGSDVEINHIRSITGGTLNMSIYLDYLNPMQGINELEAFSGGQVPVIHTWESIFTDPTGLDQPVNANWINISGMPTGGDKNTGFNTTISGEVSGCTEKLTTLPTAPATPSSSGGAGAFTFTFTGNDEKLVQNEAWNPSNTPYRTVGFLVQYKLASDTVWLNAPAATTATANAYAFDITAPTAQLIDPLKLPTTLHVLNPGAAAGPIVLTFTATAETYDVRAISIGHFLLESAAAEELALVVT